MHCMKKLMIVAMLLIFISAGVVPTTNAVEVQVPQYPQESEQLQKALSNLNNQIAEIERQIEEIGDIDSSNPELKEQLLSIKEELERNNLSMMAMININMSLSRMQTLINIIIEMKSREGENEGIANSL